MNKKAYFIICLAIIISLGIIFINNSKSKGNKNGITQNRNIENSGPVENSEIRDGIQYITINAKGGYSPRVSKSLAGIPTKIIIKTNNTFDCSASLVVRSLNFQKILPQTGEEIIDAGIPTAGSVVQGVCSMGMYSFVINFI